jgi:nitrate reductase / nitrite oxidoreductase, alpha subunit
MSTTCLYSDIVLPTASWYEKNDLNTSDMHPFIHPLSAAVDPVWQSRSTGRSTRASPRPSARSASATWVSRRGGADAHHARHPAELAQPFDVKEWKKGQCELIPGKTAPQITVVERDYPNVFKRFTALGPLMDKLGNGGKGIGWKTGTEVEQLGQAQRQDADRRRDQGMPKIVTDIDACEVILQLAPETNGHVAVKAWQALGKQTGRDHTHLALYREDEKIRYRDVQAQPRKIISSRPGAASRARRSATTPATPTCTS